MKRKLVVRHVFGNEPPHIEPISEEIRRRFQFHRLDFERHHNLKKFEDDVVGMCLELVEVEGRFRRNEAAQKHKANRAEIPEDLCGDFRPAFDELRKQRPAKKVGPTRLVKRAQQRIEQREPDEDKREELCARVTKHMAQRWLTLHRDENV